LSVGEPGRALAGNGRAVVGRRRVAEMMVERRDPAPIDAEMVGHEREAVTLRELELAAGALGQAEPGAQLAGAATKPARRLVEPYAVVRARIVDGVQHAIHPLARVGASAAERDHTDVLWADAEIAREGGHRDGRVYGVGVERGA